MLGAIGPCCGFLVVLVMALYIHGDVAARVYPNRLALWLICPLAGYWISRFWVLASRGGLLDDSLVLAIKDRISLVVSGLIVTLAILATIPWPKK